MEDVVLMLNKKVSFDYDIIKEYQVGIQLIGSEVKSIKSKKVSIKEAYVSIINGEAILKQCFISKFINANSFKEIDETRERKLLLKKKEIFDLHELVTKQGLTIVPRKIISKDGLIKVIISLVKGKTNYDKRNSLKEKDLKMEAAREIKNYN